MRTKNFINNLSYKLISLEKTSKDMEQNSEDSQGIRTGVGKPTPVRAKCNELELAQRKPSAVESSSTGALRRS